MSHMHWHPYKRNIYPPCSRWNQVARRLDNKATWTLVWMAMIAGIAALACLAI